MLIFSSKTFSKLILIWLYTKVEVGQKEDHLDVAYRFILMEMVCGLTPFFRAEVNIIYILITLLILLVSKSSKKCERIIFKIAILFRKPPPPGPLQPLANTHFGCIKLF